MKRERKSILIVTTGQISRNPRVGKEATALATAGYDVTVLYVRNVPEYDRYDQELIRRSSFRTIALDHLSRDKPARRAANVDRFRTRLARYAARIGFASADAFGPYRSLLNRAKAEPADLTIVHTETAFAVGRRLLAEGRRVAADFEDWHSRDLLPAARRNRPLRLLSELERTMASRTCYASTTSLALGAALAETYQAPVPVLVRNTFPRERVSDDRPIGTPPTLFWFSQTIGPGRGLESFVTA